MNNNLEKRFRIARLIARELMNVLSDQEKEELESWKNASESHRSEIESLRQELLSDPELLCKETDLSVSVEGEWCEFKKHHINKRTSYIKQYMRYAAILLLPVALGIYLWSNSSGRLEEAGASIEPGSFKAELRMADGKRIVLDSMTHWHMHHNTDVDIQAESNCLSYVDKRNSSDKEEYNTLVTPKGGEYSLRLSDGTVVYMNAETSLRYPISFTGHERVVEMDGEAYFKVAKDSTRPFRVRTNGAVISVLGTSFNVNTYIDGKIVTTLLEGKVQVASQTGNVELQPDMQAVTTAERTDVMKVDARNYVLWKDGVFCFTNVRLEDIMNILSRWYDVEIFFQTEYLKGLNFSVELPKYQSINETLRHIEQTGRVKFKVTGKTVVLSE